MMGQLAAVVDEPADQVALKHRMGRILDQELGDRVSALEQFQAAIDLDPGHLQSLEAMRGIHVDSGDWVAAAKTLGLEVEHTEQDRIRAARLVELGRIRAERLDDEPGAVQAFEAAFAADADNEDAMLPLVDAYVARERHEDAFPLLQTLVLRCDKCDDDEKHRLASMLGETATALGNADEAVRAYERAYQLQNDDPATLKGLAGAYFRAERWDDAFKYHQLILVQHRDSLGRDEITEVFYRLGVVKREQGEDKKARNMFDKALEEDTHYVPALEAMVDLQAAEGDWDSVVQYKKRILDVADEPSVRAALLVELGDLWQEKLGNPDAAAEAYTESFDLEPAQPRRAPQASRRLSGGRALVRGDRRDRARLWARGARRGQGQVHVHDRRHPARQARGRRRRPRALQRCARPRLHAAQALRGGQQAAQPAERLEGARARVPQDASPHHQRGQHGPRAQSLAHARHHLPRPSAELRRSGGVVQDGGGAQAGRRGRAPDPGRALRDDAGKDGRGDRRAPVAAQRPTRTGSTRTGPSTSSTSTRAPTTKHGASLAR